jgi:hypothetical protein
MDFAVPRLWYYKAWAELTPALENKKEEEKERCLLFARAGHHVF